MLFTFFQPQSLPSITYQLFLFTVSCRNDNVPKFVSIFNKQDAYNDEDPYSVPSLPTSKRPQSIKKSSNNKKIDINQKPPELPPRDFAKIKKSKAKNIPKVFRSLVKSENRKETRRDSKKNVDYGKLILIYIF